MSDAEGLSQGDPTDRLVMPVTSNATLECSRFCITNCGLYDQAQEQTVMVSAMMTGKTLIASLREGDLVVQAEDESQLPELVITCKGPKKKYWLAGEFVCRKNTKIDTA